MAEDKDKEIDEIEEEKEESELDESEEKDEIESGEVSEENGNGDMEVLEKEALNLKDMDENRVVGTEITKEMKKSYIDYAMSVIVSRALPAVEDVLKPVHRRILYAMKLMGLEKGMTKKS